MRTLRPLVLGSLVLALAAAPAGATGGLVTIKQERVPGGSLEQSWAAGFGLSDRLTAQTLVTGDPAFPTPSGDNTVVRLVSSLAPDSGGIGCSALDPSFNADYTWEGYVNVGEGSARRGLVFRADPSIGFESHYQFVFQPGLSRIAVRKVVNRIGATLRDWASSTLPGGFPQPHSWHHLKVQTEANAIRVWYDGVELTSASGSPGPIVDSSSPLLTGWVGTYVFRFDVSFVPALFDDLKLGVAKATPTTGTSWGRIKSLYR